jgi:hypothetical protein
MTKQFFDDSDAKFKAKQEPMELTNPQIKEIMLANGFTVKDGLEDLKPYVYAAARALLAAAKA